MKDIKILTIGKEKIDCQEYTKRMRWKIELLQFPHAKKSSAEEQKREESKQMLTKVQPKAYLIALHEHGKQLSSIEFAAAIREKPSVTFAIGGAYGHGDEILQRADLQLSLSKMTFTHIHAGIILTEQIYRAYTIINNQPYHKN